MKHISKIFLVILICLTVIKPAIVQAGGGEEIVVDVDGTVIENVGTDNKDYPVKENVENSDRIKSDSRQFITFKTKDEKMFYLIIDHNKEQDNVKLLTDVKESDLESLVKDKTPVVKQDEIKIDTNINQTEIKQEEVKKEEPKTKSSLGSYIVLGGVILLVIGIGYYFKVVKTKKDKEKYSEEEEEDDFFAESEYEKEKIDENDKYK